MARRPWPLVGDSLGRKVNGFYAGYMDCRLDGDI